MNEKSTKKKAQVFAYNLDNKKKSPRNSNAASPPKSKAAAAEIWPKIPKLVSNEKKSKLMSGSGLKKQLTDIQKSPYLR